MGTHSDRRRDFFHFDLLYIFLFTVRLLCFATGCVGERFRGQARTPNLRLGAPSTITNTQGVKYGPVCPPTHPSV